MSMAVSAENRLIAAEKQRDEALRDLAKLRELALDYNREDSEDCRACSAAEWVKVDGVALDACPYHLGFDDGMLAQPVDE